MSHYKTAIKFTFAVTAVLFVIKQAKAGTFGAQVQSLVNNVA